MLRSEPSRVGRRCRVMSSETLAGWAFNCETSKSFTDDYSPFAVVLLLPGCERGTGDPRGNGARRVALGHDEDRGMQTSHQFTSVTVKEARSCCRVRSKGTTESKPWKAGLLFSSRWWPGHLFVKGHSYRRVGQWRCRWVQLYASVSEAFEVSARGISWHLQAIARTSLAYHWRIVRFSACHPFPVKGPILEDTRGRSKLGCRCVTSLGTQQPGGNGPRLPWRLWGCASGV